MNTATIIRNERQTYEHYRAVYIAAIERGATPMEAKAAVVADAEHYGAATRTSGEAGVKVEAASGRFIKIVE